MARSPARFVVVTGPPGSGKTTLATSVATGLGLPLISKDAIKEALLAVCTVPDEAASRALGRSSMEVLYRLASDASTGAVLDAKFRRTQSVTRLARLDGQVVELHCRCRREVALRRYRARTASRHPGHFDAQRADDELWDADMVGPLGGGWPVLEADTNDEVDVPSTLAGLARLLDES